MNEEINVITNEIITNEIITNEIFEVNDSKTLYKVAQDINTMLSVLNFTIIIIFLFYYIRISFFKVRK